jgi:hypothetical protein
VANQKKQRAKEPTQGKNLHRLTHRLYRIAQDDAGRAIAIPKKGPQVALPFKGHGGSLRTQLTRRFFQQFGSPPSTQALEGVMRVLEAEASEGERQRLHLRSAPHPDGGLVIDLGDRDGSVVIVAGGTWRVNRKPPSGVVFRRTKMTEAMPRPRKGGQLDELRNLLNVTDEGWELIRSWLACALRSDIPVPILTVTGRQGTAKTMLGRFLVNLIDPNPSPLRAPPKSLEDWPTVASGSRVVGLDNISRISEEMSDALCRAVTGEGSAKRSLYTDDELFVVSFRRALLLTSIDTGGLRGDLGERLLPVELQPIVKRKDERKLEDAFDHKRAAMLGGLLDLLAEIQANPVEVEDAPRMADAAGIMAAVDAATGSKSLDSYREGLGSVVGQVLDSDPVAAALVELMEKRGGKKFMGTATALYDLLRPYASESNWPANAQKLSGRLKRLAPNLEQVHALSIKHSRGDKRQITISRSRRRSR